jgi:hypothetical protein
MGAVRAALSEVLVVTLQYGGISKMVLDVVNSCEDTVVGVTMNHIVEVQMAALLNLLIISIELCNKNAEKYFYIHLKCKRAYCVKTWWIHCIFCCQVETLKPVKMVRDLPYIAAQLLSVFQQQNVFCTLFLCLMAKRIHRHYIQVHGGYCVMTLIHDVR